jgi:hypothetical protein
MHMPQLQPIRNRWYDQGREWFRVIMLEDAFGLRALAQYALQSSRNVWDACEEGHAAVRQGPRDAAERGMSSLAIARVWENCRPDMDHVTFMDGRIRQDVLMFLTQRFRQPSSRRFACCLGLSRQFGVSLKSPCVSDRAQEALSGRAL